MRRILLWYLPIAVGLLAVCIFGYGFVSFLRGDRGTPVDWVPNRHAPVVETATAGTLLPIILGDSLARGTGDETGLGIGGRLDGELKRRSIEAKPTVNLAVNGAKTKDLLSQLQSHNVQTLLAQSNVIIVSIGGNDLWGGTDWRSAPPRDPDAVMGQVLDRIDRILQLIRGANPKARIFLVGLYNPFVATPDGASLTALVNKWNGKLLERFGVDPNFTLVPTSDIFSHRERLSFDHFHPADEGYALIARRIADSL